MEINLFDESIHGIHTILDTYKNHQVVRNLLVRKDVCVYDLGCGVPDFLYYMFHLYECIDEIVGVDQNWVNIVEKTNGTGYFMYDLYKYLLNEKPSWVKAASKNILNEEDYRKHFKLMYRTDIYSFFENLEYLNKQCDYLILSNILHLMKNEPTLFKDSIDKLKTGGLIYARVNHQLNINSIRNGQTPFTEECFINLFNDAGFESIDYLLFAYPKQDEKENNIEFKSSGYKEGILYFGVKR